jgi:membrane-associated phospholipid phosphatase
MTDPVYHRLLIGLLLATVTAQAVFAAFPGIDLAVSGLFADGRAGFRWSQGWLNTVNFILRRMGEAVAFGLVIWVILGGLFRKLKGDDLRAWAFAALTVVLSSGVIVNLILKAHVGRSRPAGLSIFGGSAQFTPAWQVTDQCARNCSFTSGEVALAGSLAIVALVLSWPRLQTAMGRFLALAMACVYVGGVSLLRIGLGRHFPSDVVFSLLIAAAVAVFLYPVLGVGRARLAFDPSQPLRLAAGMIAAGKRRARAMFDRAS